MRWEGQQNGGLRVLGYSAASGEDAAHAAASSSSCPPQAAVTSCPSPHLSLPQNQAALPQQRRQHARLPAAATASRSRCCARGRTSRNRSAATGRSPCSCTCCTSAQACGRPARACTHNVRRSCHAWERKSSSGRDSQAPGSPPPSIQAPTTDGRGSCVCICSAWKVPRCGNHFLQRNTCVKNGGITLQRVV